VVLLAACGGAAATPCAPRVLARGTLAYDAVATADAVIAIELEERFALIVHDATTGAARATIDLGPASQDIVALAIDPSRRTAYVGGKDQQVRAIDLDRGAVIATWPVGADVTSLAATHDYVAIADATGTLCLRGKGGALLQCVADATDGPIALDGDRIRTGDRAYALPSLAVTRVQDLPAPAMHPAVRFGGAIHAVRPGPDGTAIAAWVHALDDPSVVLVPRCGV
jgi:hypothetical protein